MKVDFFVGDGFLFLASALGITRNDLTTGLRLGENPSILELPSLYRCWQVAKCRCDTQPGKYRLVYK